MREVRSLRGERSIATPQQDPKAGYDRCGGTRLALLLVTAAMVSLGCLPVLVPPVKIRGGVGAGQMVSDHPNDGSMLGSFRAGVYPLQLAKDGHKEPLDLGLGYGIEGVTGPSRSRTASRSEPSPAGPKFIEETFAEVGYYPWGFDSEDARGRIGGFASGQVLWTERGGKTRFGAGFDAGLAAEWTGIMQKPVVSSDDDKRVFAGYAYGQWSIGLYAAAGGRDVDGFSGWAMTAGIVGRLPLLVGLLCCVNPWSSQKK